MIKVIALRACVSIDAVVWYRCSCYRCYYFIAADDVVLDIVVAGDLVVAAMLYLAFLLSVILLLD